ncbi:MAG: CAP domain-containing protein [Sorangiineae bacterium]|nr:CAP domain-containing protein [Polyangiaceae bacterium]MEB2323518.1 CAP domain-containing protein [Sorangiineae bacterium]
MRRHALASLASLALLAALFGCRPGGSARETYQPVGGDVTRPTGPLRLADARAYLLALVNRDRAEAGLGAVELDDTATRAAQRHVEDMTTRGFTAHWGSDGSVPEQRYTEAGGTDVAQENAACFFDGEARALDPDPRFDPGALERLEAAFLGEVPPNDGHRRNILKPVHNRLGLGLAQPVGIAQPCLAQEFVDDYGEYGALPAEARVGATVDVTGTITAPVEFGGVGLARIEPARPTPAAALNQTSTYAVPEPYVLFFPAGFQTPRPVSVQGNRFGIEVALDDRRRPGRYEVSVWGKYPGSDALVMVSLRTVTVR